MSRTRSITDQQVLDAAIEIIGNDGIRALTFASLSARTKLAPPTLVQRFRTKENLLMQAAQHCMSDTEAAFAIAQARQGSPLDAIVQGFSSLAASINSPEHFANGLAILQLALKDPQLRVLLRNNANNTRSRVRQLLDEAVATGEIRPCDTEMLASCLQNTFEGATTTWSVYRQGTAAEWVAVQLEQVINPYRKIIKEK